MRRRLATVIFLSGCLSGCLSGGLSACLSGCISGNAISDRSGDAGAPDAVVPDTALDAGPSPDAAPPCVPGRAEVCACPNGPQGIRLCGADGRFGPCDCASPPADAARDAGGPDVTPADALPPDAAVPCTPGEVGQRACGLNGRGTESRSCGEVGVFGPWSECVDPDECTDAAEESRACGLNGDGTEVRTCVVGRWGTFGACVDGAECVNGAVERRPCGLNGNGRESRTCADGQWGAYGACEGDPDECLEGSEASEACGVNGNGTRVRICLDGRYSQFGPCDDPDRACDDGAVETLPCGLNRRGVQSHTCVGDRFGPLGECVDPDSCVDGAVRQQACGFNGRGLERRTCEAGAFGAFRACDDPDDCVDGSEHTEACGLNGRGIRAAVCLGGRLGALGACEDPDECVDRAVEVAPEPCGLNGRGRSERRCDFGQWSDFGACVDPDECVDGRAEVDPCGAADAGERSRACVAGRWGEFGPCVGAEECPDTENPRCGPPRPERCNGLDDDQDGEVDEGLDGVAVPDQGPFADAVNAALDAGLQALRNLEQRTGLLDGDATHNFFAILAFLERRVGNPWAGPPGGYAALDQADRDLVRRLLVQTIAANPALRDPFAVPYSYTTGGDLMALSAFLASGGPDQVGAAVGVSRALLNGLQALQSIQGEGVLGWDYTTPGRDLSTTHFAANGLAAADPIIEGSAATLGRLAAMLPGNTSADGGMSYRGEAQDTASSSMTSAGLWVYGLAGVRPDEDGPQRALTWLRENYLFDGMTGGSFTPTSTYYAFWALTKAMVYVGPEHAALFGDRAPEALGFPDAPVGAYFDMAYTLLDWQGPDGIWGGGFGDSPQGWTELSSHGFALLTLERSTGGVRFFDDGSETVPSCANEVDDDGDGQIDFPQDPECRFACTVSEGPQPACDNDLDDDADGRTDYPDDPGCTRPADDGEAGGGCDDRLDNDADGATDYPADPGCDGPLDDSEADPLAPPACADGADNDADGLVDFGEDPQCYAAAQDDEGGSYACPEGIVAEPLPAAGEVRGSNVDAPNVLEGSCGGIRGGERVFALVANGPERVSLSTAHDGTTFDTALYVLGACRPGAAELACSQDISDQDPLSAVAVELPGAGVYFVVVDAQIGEGDFLLTVTRHPLAVACGDRLDNDGDGAVDLADPGCGGPGDDDEADPPAPPACADAADNDGDGVVDFPAEPGCERPGDTDEADPPAPPPCDDGLDNDQDGATDYPADSNCRGRGGDSEFGPPAACRNRRDDDADGLTDHPFDPGCSLPSDGDEADPASPPACANGLDDDRDGVADLPFDPGCEAAGDDDEGDPARPAVCANGRDDDGDDRVDFPFDPGCTHAGDADEADPQWLPGCADGVDNDADGRTDFPDDPGCRFAADTDESDPGMLPPRCADGVDNDLDGDVDALDLGCVDAADDTEDDPAVVPMCGDGEDNDADGHIDWPADAGCTARGDPGEDQACRPAVQTPLVPRNGRGVGETREGGEDRYRASCGAYDAPEAVYKYVLAGAATLTFSLDNPGTDFPAVLAVRRDCEVAASQLGCTGQGAAPVPTITVEDAPPGEYFVFVDGAAPGRIVSSGGLIALPPSPDGLQATHNDLGPNGWADGGNDAFDLFGTTVVTHNGRDAQIDVSAGQRQQVVNGYALDVTSDWPHQNVWRMRLEPAVPDDERPVTVMIGSLDFGGGNLGCDRDCLALASIDYEGSPIAYFTSSDARDPDTVQMLVPSDPEHLGRVAYENVLDNVRITATDVTLPVTFYVAVTNGNLGLAAAALVDDLEPGGAQGPRFGHFELSIRED